MLPNVNETTIENATHKNIFEDYGIYCTDFPLYYHLHLAAYLLFI